MERLLKRWQLNTLQFYSGTAVFAFSVFLLVYRLKSLTYGRLAPTEIATLNQARSWHTIWHSMFDAPYLVLLRLGHYVSHTVFAARLPGVLIGLLWLGLFYYVLLRWVGWRVANLGVLLLATSSLFLHSVRIVNAAMLEPVSIVALLALYVITHKQPSGWHLPWWLLALGLMLYVPGMPAFILIAIVINNRNLRSSWAQANAKLRFASIAIGLVTFTPIFYFIVRTSLTDAHLHNLRLWLGFGLPFSLQALSRFWQAFYGLPIHLFYRGSSNAVISMAHQPWVNIAVGLLAVMGAYVAIVRWQELRWRYVAILLGFSWLLVGLNGIGETVSATLIYIMAVIGVTYLLSEWQKVFPRNPIARQAGLLMVALIIAACSWYGIRSYFVAWPHNPDTHRIFAIQANQ